MVAATMSIDLDPETAEAVAEASTNYAVTNYAVTNYAGKIWITNRCHCNPSDRSRYESHTVAS